MDLGAKIDEKTAQKALSAVATALLPGEEVRLLVKVNKVSPTLQMVAVTNARLLAFTQHGIAKMLTFRPDEIGEVRLEAKRMSKANVLLVTPEATEVSLGTLNGSDDDGPLLQAAAHALRDAGWPAHMDAPDTSVGSQGMRPDVEAAYSRVNSKMGTKRDIKKLPEYLTSGEEVLDMASGATGGNTGLLVATNRRVLFVSEGIMNHSFEDFPYDRITTVTVSRGLALGKVVVHTAGVARIIENVAKADAERLGGVIRARVEAVTRERHAPPAPPPQVLFRPLRNRPVLPRGCASSQPFGTKGS